MQRLLRASHFSLPSSQGTLLAAFSCFLLWTFATWLLEGRVHTLLRPDAVVDRLLYTGIANIAIGQIGAFAILALLLHGAGIQRRPPPFPPLQHRSVAVLAALLLGLGYYVSAGGSFDHPTMFINTFAQVFTVSAAEVIVCWGLLGVATESWLRAHRGAWWNSAGAAAVASIAFGLYHFAHSPPFNTPTTVAFLMLVGLGTSLFFFVSRDLLATIIFHNFPAVAGVTAALTESGEQQALTHLQPALLTTAALSVLIVWVGGRVTLARKTQAG